MSIIGYYLDPTAVAAGVITILTVESLSFAICASLYLVTLRAAGRQVTVITGLRLAARRGWPVLGWTLVSFAIVVIGFQVPLFADLFLGTPIAILASTVAGIGLLTVFAASMIYGAVVAYFRAGSASESMPPILQLTLWGLLSVPVGVLASAEHIVTYAELSTFLTTEELAAEIAPEVDTLPPLQRQPTTQFDRPEFGIEDNGITLNRQELGELFTGRHPRAIRLAVDQFMTELAGSPVRGTEITVGGLPAFEYEFAYSSSAVPTLRSHSFVLIDGPTQYLINSESTDTCRDDMARVTEVVLRSLQHR